MGLVNNIGTVIIIHYLHSMEWITNLIGTVNYLCNMCAIILFSVKMGHNPSKYYGTVIYGEMHLNRYRKCDLNPGVNEQLCILKIVNAVVARVSEEKICTFYRSLGKKWAKLLYNLHNFEVNFWCFRSGF